MLQHLIIQFPLYYPSSVRLTVSEKKKKREKKKRRGGGGEGGEREGRQEKQRAKTVTVKSCGRYNYYFLIPQFDLIYASIFCK